MQPHVPTMFVFFNFVLFFCFFRVKGQGNKAEGQSDEGAITNLFFVLIAFRQRERVMADTQE